MLRAILPALLGCSAPTPAVQRPATVDRDPPRIAVANQPLETRQGAPLAVFFRADEAVRLEVSALGQERVAFPVGDQTWRVLIGVPIRAEPGPAMLSARATDAWGNLTEIELPLLVHPVDWPETGKLPMSRAKSKVEPDGVKAMRSERDAVYRSRSATQRWSAPMRIPVAEGVHTSAFGAFREYPDGSRNHHDAEDIARRRGVPIQAAADGVVALAKLQEVHGNAVLIDHGHQVVSLYSHLDQLEVEVGQQILAGERLGTMGSTGRTTGPHLHWGVVVDEVPVDPMVWTRTDFAVPDDAAFSEAR